jgi:Raf kinase inhibitor-like YbhB/YbcL family protein
MTQSDRRGRAGSRGLVEENAMKSFVALALVLLPLVALAAGTFTLESAEVKPGATIATAQLYKGFGCDGANVSPSLAWKNAPAGTKSFAVTVYDPDASTGSGWWHWIVFNIPAGVTSLSAGVGNPASGQTPKGAVQSKSDFGKPGYGGACPPQGDKPHRYVFTVYALKVDKIDADENASGAMVGFMLNANKLDKASFTATYGRK